MCMPFRKHASMCLGTPRKHQKFLLRTVILFIMLHFMALSIANNVEHQSQMNEI